MNRYLIILFLFTLTSCCKDSIEVNRYNLSDNEKEFIPYSDNQTIRFIHSNGLQFNMNVTNIYTEFERTKTEHCGENYVSSEIKTAKLESEIPELMISVSITPKEFNPIMGIDINNSYLQKDLTNKADYDTLLINNNKYINVYVFENQISDTTIIYPYKVLYNRTYGIIQIIMTNNEKFTISK